MKGSTNSIHKRRLEVEKAVISLATNQPGQSVPDGTGFSLSYGEDTRRYVWEGSEIVLEIPSGVAYTLAYDEMEGFRKPETATYTAYSGNSRSINALYQQCVLSVSFGDNHSGLDEVSALKASVEGDGVSASLGNGESVRVPFGKVLTITSPAVEGYSSPSVITYTTGEANKVFALPYRTELLTINVGGVDSGFTISVKDINGNVIATQTEATATHKIPSGKQYYVEASGVTNYITPSATPLRTASDVDDAANIVNLTYERGIETLTVNVTGLSSGFTIYVKDSEGNTLGSQTTASGTYQIKAGTTYHVEASGVSGYTTPANSASRTAVTGGVHSVTMGYVVADPGITNPTNGVWILSTEGKYYTTDNWLSSKTADCVAVITSNCRFGIALTEASSTMQIHSSYSGTLENYMTAISDEAQAKADYDGATNTTNIMKLQSSTSYAAGWCNAFSFPSGKKGFLPSLGQMWAAYSNKSAVDAALIKAGGSALTSAYHWTSTFWGVAGGYRSCWILLWGDGYVSDFSLNFDYRVRAFASI